MADQEYLDILKKGAAAWNQWREVHPAIIYPDFSRANLIGADLSFADLRHAFLSEADLSGAFLSEATLSEANLRRATLSGADLGEADFRRATLSGADLSEVDLRGADLRFATLSGADLKEAIVGWTSFGGVDLSVVKNLETVMHRAPSTIGIDTIYRSGGTIPEAFLKGAGVPDSFLTNMRALVESMSPIDFYSCFISYSSKDQGFAERLYADLQSKGVRCWYAPEDMKTGDEFRSRIDEAIRIHDKLLLVLSEHSVESTWVKKEVETAFEKEEQQKRLVLFPVRLDDTVMQTTKAWAADIRRMRHITDFTWWKDHDTYQKVFTRLLRDLEAEAQK